MGINKPSLYHVFGSKEELFIRALERYGRSYHEHLDAVLAYPIVYEVLESYLRSTVKAVRAGNEPGCLSIQGGLACGPSNARIPQLLADYRHGIGDAVANALAKTVHPGRWKASTPRPWRATPRRLGRGLPWMPRGECRKRGWTPWSTWRWRGSGASLPLEVLRSGPTASPKRGSSRTAAEARSGAQTGSATTARTMSRNWPDG